jgi:hypothetical protein
MQADNKIEAGPLPTIEVLEIVADWRECLTMRIRRARLCQEYADISPEAIMALSAETADFKRVCQALKQEIRR